MNPTWRHRCWTERDHGGDDPYGGGHDWQPELTDQRCSWWVATGREAIDEQRSVVLADEQLLLPRDADVADGDRIVRVVDARGNVVFDADQASGLAREVEHVADHDDLRVASLRSTS